MTSSAPPEFSGSDPAQDFAQALEHHQAKRLDQARQLYMKILASYPDHPDSLHLLGILESQQGNPEQSEPLIRRAIALQPRTAMYHQNLASLLADRGRYADSIAEAQTALAIQPIYPEAHVTLSRSFGRTGNLPAAVHHAKAALAQRPNFPDAYLHLGNAFYWLSDFPAALQAYQTAASLRPHFGDALRNIGNTLAKLGHLASAIPAYQQAFAVDHHTDSAGNLAMALLNSGDPAAAIPIFAEALKLSPQNYYAHSNLLYAQHFLPSPNPAEIFRAHQTWAAKFAPPVPRDSRVTSHDSRVRIGYVSCDFRAHPVAQFMENLFAHHDRDQFEIFAYADLIAPDEVTRRLQPLVPNWRPITGRPDAQIAEQIRADRIDILVDLAGHTADHRLLVFAHKPAPVQITYLGYPDTTGMPAMDYRITDSYADPTGADQFYTEKLLRLDPTFLCFTPPPISPAPAPSPFIKNRHITFGSFNALPKINPPLVALWSQILRQVPDSRLTLKARALDDPELAARLRAQFAAQQIDPLRIQFLKCVTDSALHLSLYSHIDIALDTFPYNGTTTTCEALWMSVPVVTLAGPIHASRVGHSILANLGLPEFVAAAPEAYIQTAATLARDTDRLQELRSTLRQRLQSSPLLDAPAFARKIEAAYRSVLAR